MSIRGSLEALVKSQMVSASRARDILSRIEQCGGDADRDEAPPPPRNKRQPKRRSLRRV